MLKTPKDVLSQADTTKLMLQRYRLVAICPESGAMLNQTNGKGMGGLPTYVLILPNKTVAERGGYLSRYDWDYPAGRKFVRAWSDSEAITAANEKLDKMLSTKRTEIRLRRELFYLCNAVQKEHIDHDPEFCEICNCVLNSLEALEKKTD